MILSRSSLFVFAIGIFSYLNNPVILADTVKSTLQDQKAVELTVYNNNLGLVKDVREISLPEGQGELRFMDVASGINPVTVRAKSLNSPADFGILEQNYEYDLINYQKLLDKYVGKKIKLLTTHEFKDKEEITEALLLSNNEGQVYQIGNEIYLGHPGIKILPEIPENLIAKPTLTWLFTNKSKKPHRLELSYLTENISWKADYVAVLSKDDKAIDLSGWVTVNNQSGAEYKNAKLKLIAGQVNRVQPEYQNYAPKAMMARADFAAEPQFQEQAFFEYHIYNLQRNATLKDKQTKQIQLLEASGAGSEKELVIYGNQSFWTYPQGGQTQKAPVNVYLKFKNSKINKLGMPLPEGTVRLYKKDASDSLQFIGEDQIKHTPKDEEVRLKIGEAFDIAADRTQKDYSQIGTSVHESEWEISIRNRKEEDIRVVILEPLYGDWEILKSSHPSTKQDAFTARFEVPVKKNEEVKVTYRVRVRT